MYIFWAVLHTNYSLLSRNLKLRFACLKSRFLKTDTPNHTDTPLTLATPLWSGRCTLYQILRLVFMFIKDGEVFHQIYRGEMDEEAMYAKISDTLKLLQKGGRDE